MPAYNPDIKMSNADKLKTATWFRCINEAIKLQTYPEDWQGHVSGVLSRNEARAEELESEVNAERVAP